MFNPAGVAQPPISLPLGLVFLTAAPGTELRHSGDMGSSSAARPPQTLSVRSRSCFEEGGEESPGQCRDAPLPVWLLPRQCTAA